MDLPPGCRLDVLTLECGHQTCAVAWHGVARTGLATCPRCHRAARVLSSGRAPWQGPTRHAG